MLLPRHLPSRAARRGSRNRFRNAAVAASAAMLVLGPLAATASADPAKAPTPNLPVDLATAVQRDLKISPQEYLHRADLAQHVSDFATTAQREYPQTFAGAWLNDAGKAVIALAPGAGHDDASKAATTAGYQVKQVAKTETALRSEKNAFQQWLSGQPKSVSEKVRGAVIDTVNNALAVRVDKAGLPMPGFIDPARVIVMAAAPTGPQQSDIAKASAVAGQMRTTQVAAGDAYASVAGKMQLICSSGFNGTDSRGNVVNITAGHCDPNIPAAGTANAPAMYEVAPGEHLGAQLGTFQKSVLGAQDYSIVAINSAARNRFSNNLVRVPGQAPLAITGVANPVVGAPVCKSGSRTGFSCGVVSAVDQEVQVGDHNLEHSFSANICALPGDSGGPLVSGTKALGVSSASSVADYPICEIPNLIGALTGNAPQLFAQPLSAVLSANPGLRLRTN
ncbi:S1 family peptidase [Nocardia jiangxiensis]|uniref:S1 family peptidase n=1 Tax=Nocardia jiangxiensis TaxID=282685 RepID=A0ABW6SFF6_9NOCA|nr:S1 family peptidase [Nocardia jiangxiensis]